MIYDRSTSLCPPCWSLVLSFGPELTLQSLVPQNRHWLGPSWTSWPCASERRPLSHTRKWMTCRTRYCNPWSYRRLFNHLAPTTTAVFWVLIVIVAIPFFLFIAHSQPSPSEFHRPRRVNGGLCWWASLLDGLCWFHLHHLSIWKFSEARMMSAPLSLFFYAGHRRRFTLVVGNRLPLSACRSKWNEMKGVLLTVLDCFW